MLYTIATWVLVIGIAVLAFAAVRGVALWYWRVNEIVERLDAIRMILEKGERNDTQNA